MIRALLRSTIACSAVLSTACLGHPPTIDGGPGAPVRSSDLWTPARPLPADARVPATPAPLAAVSPAALGQLTLADVVDMALKANPATRVSWAQARAAADAYGSSRGSLFPALDADLNAIRSRSLALPGRVAGERTQYGPSLTLSYLALDFGGRGGGIESAKQTAIAADLAHNTVIQNTILAVESAAFSYLATRALRDAQRTTRQEAEASLAAAEERHRVGLATIADVLQAKTARSQAELALETLDGLLQVSRGSLAVAIGLPANTAIDIPEVPAADSVGFVTESVDSLIARAVRSRPELAQARAQASASAAEIRVARSARMPSLLLGSTGGYTASNVSTFQGNTYTLNAGLSVPLFAGFSRQYDVRNATDEYDAAAARVETTRQQIALQVFTAYYLLQTATQRVHTAADLLASAQQSETVARGRYREGVGSIVDLLIAQSALATARAQDAQTRWEWRAALAQLAHDAGALGIHGDALIPLAAAPVRNR
jgi:outer membrane protein